MKEIIIIIIIVFTQNPLAREIEREIKRAKDEFRCKPEKKE